MMTSMLLKTAYTPILLILITTVITITKIIIKNTDRLIKRGDVHIRVNVSPALLAYSISS